MVTPTFYVSVLFLHEWNYFITPLFSLSIGGRHNPQRPWATPSLCDRINAECSAEMGHIDGKGGPEKLTVRT